MAGSNTYSESFAEGQLTQPLRVALDLRTWRMSGLGTYVRELLGAMTRLGLPIQWTLVGPQSLREQMPEELLIERWHDFDAPIYSGRSFFHYPALGDVDLFHYPHYNLPWVRARARLVNVFDLFHIHYGSWAKRQYQKWMLRHLRWTSAQLLTASEKTRRELQQWGHIPPQRICSIALGPGQTVSGPAGSAGDSFPGRDADSSALGCWWWALISRIRITVSCSRP